MNAVETNNTILQKGETKQENHMVRKNCRITFLTM